jgi:hypothetical protein
LLIDAAESESYAYQTYNAYGRRRSRQRATCAGRRLADRRGGRVPWTNWSQEVKLADYYSDSDNAANLKTLIALTRQARR